MGFLLSLFQSKMARQIGAAILFIVGIFGLGAKWRGDKEKAKDAKEAIETHERINDADTGKGDVDADRDWLRKRGKS